MDKYKMEFFLNKITIGDMEEAEKIFNGNYTIYYTQDKLIITLEE